MRISLVLLVMACGSSDKAAAPGQVSGSAAPMAQTARDAMVLVCDAWERSGAKERPAAEQPHVMTAWMREQVTNADVRRVLDELALDTWPSAKSRLVALATQHGAMPCALGEAVSRPALPVELPALSGPSEPDDPSAPLVVVSRTAITYERQRDASRDDDAVGAAAAVAGPAGAAPTAADRVVASLDNGVLAASGLDKDGTVASLAKRVAAAPGTRVRLAFDRRTPMTTALAVITSFTAGDRGSVAIVGEQNGESRLLPLDVTAGATGASYAVVGKPQGLTLWTVVRGRLGEQRVTASLDGGVGQIMRELVTLAPRAGSASKIAVAVTLDPALDVDRLVQLVAALRLTSRPTLAKRLE